MACTFEAIKTYLNTAKSLGYVYNFEFSYEAQRDPDTVPEELRNILQQLVQNLNMALEKTKLKENMLPVKENQDLDVVNIDGKKSTNKDERLIQIKVDRDEINRRISSFITRKRKEVDNWNAQEFCNNLLLQDDNPIIVEGELSSCARVDAIFVPRSGAKSHVKVSRVENVWGPQLNQPLSFQTVKKPSQPTLRQNSLEDIEERLKNMESHLKIKSENNVKRSVYSRLKDLEDRILFLEGLSPDYFHTGVPNVRSPVKRAKLENPYKNYSVDELQKRMKGLKEQLLMRSQNTTES